MLLLYPPVLNVLTPGALADSAAEAVAARADAADAVAVAARVVAFMPCCGATLDSDGAK
jgi:hypothetical protein